MGFHNAQFNFSLDSTRMGEIFQGESPSRNKGTLAVTDPLKGFPVPELPEMPNEHSPGIKRYGSLRLLWPTIYSWLVIVIYKDSSKLVVNMIGCFNKSSFI